MASLWVITGFLGRLSQSEFHSAAVGVVPLADSTLVFLFVGADLLIAADVL